MNTVLKIADTFTDLSKFARMVCERKGDYGCLIAETIYGEALVIGVFHKTKSPYDFCTEFIAHLRTGSKVFDGGEWLYVELPEDLLEFLKEGKNADSKPSLDAGTGGIHDVGCIG